MKVNMTPNPLDVVTIHASQGDTEARQWEFELHNNGELIDTSDVKEQLVFKAYKGGTEQILPENGSTPTTSPFLGDIKYPQGLLSDQEFLYRESPTEEDGLANIVGIKGQTLKWNQTVQVSNIVATKTVNGVTFTNNSDGTVTMSGTANNLVVTPIATGVTLEQNHVYYLGKSSTWSFMNGYGADGYGLIKHNRANATIIYAYIQNGNSVNSTVSVQCIDFTKLFGETKANEIFAMGTDDGIAYFKSFFPLDYYPYNSGSLIPFMGNGIKTVGKNRMPRLVAGTYSLNGITARVDNDGYIYVSGNAYTSGTSITIPLEESFELKKGMYCHAFNNRAEASITPTFTTWYFSLTPINRIAQCPDSADGTVVTNIRLYIAANINPNITLRPMLAFTNEVTPYEPYTSSTLSLPISTYFSNGMKSAGSVYDELTETKAITRTNQINLWEKSWQKHPTLNNTYWSSDIIDSAKNILNGNRWYSYGICNVYPIRYEAFDGTQMMIALYYDNSLSAYRCFITDLNANNISADDFKTRLQTLNAQLVYAIDAPTETEFTTASLVTEDAEIPLSNEDGILIGKCTEQLSSESGFFDAKIKLSDSDGDCYSNKVQLHVERSPQ